MPAAAVIPAPIAYINVVAVKKLVVEVRECVFMRASLECSQPPPSNRCSGVFSYFTTPLVVYCEKIRVFKAGVCLNRLAWIMIEGFRVRFDWFVHEARLKGTVGGIHIH